MARDDKSNYYDAGGIESLDIIQAKITPEEYLGFLKGTALRYLLRAPFKHSAQGRDLEKAANYTRWASEHAAAMELISNKVDPYKQRRSGFATDNLAESGNGL